MSTKITETDISSDVTRHTATAWPVPGEPTLWSVTWLPGRALTRDQAITAMTIAETLAAHDVIGDPLHTGHRLWPHIDQWAAELGINGPRAVALATMPPEDCEQPDSGQGDTIAEAPRANRDGDPCPSWCVQTHDELLIAGRPEFGYMNGHVSDPMTGQLTPKVEVRVRRSGAGEGARVDVTRYTLPVLSLAADKAVALAALLESLHGASDLAQLVDEMRAAAAIVSDGDQ